jgi:putative transposase
VQVDARGIPLSLVVTGANRNDVSELAVLLDARVVAPLPDEDGVVPTENLCADAGYYGQPAETAMREHGYIPHVRSRHEEKVRKRRRRGYRARRWVVEACHSWFTRFRKLLVRFEKTLQSALALHQLAAAIIAFRRTTFMYGPY